MRRNVFLLALSTGVAANWAQIESDDKLSGFDSAFQKEPPKFPFYMVDNTDNLNGVAPVNGQQNGATWPQSGSYKSFMKNLNDKKASGKPLVSTLSEQERTRIMQEDGFWLSDLSEKGKAPLAGNNYTFYRNVLDYGADPTGETDTVEAINAAIQDGDRCGEECGNTFALGAIVYFPRGVYKICNPIVQLYYTQFIGDPFFPPTIKGCDNFTGIALIDTDPYIPNAANPDGTGVNWYINQNQFFRQIRNFVFDLTEMPAATDDHGQQLVPTGLHWQVAQATSLQHLTFKMPKAENGKNVTHVGIFTENGSGGFVSDLEFEGGAIGWRVGSQQYTARGLKFTNCVTAVQMVWDWGFNWQQITVDGGTIAFNISGRGGIRNQGIGSVSIIDSIIRNVPIGVLTNKHPKQPPNIVIDNSQFENVPTVVQIDTGEVLLSGSQTVDLWAHGRQYQGGDGEYKTGFVKRRAPVPTELLKDGKLFVRSRPQYENRPISGFRIATDHDIKNDGTGDNTDSINSFLKDAAAAGQVAYFPGGIYACEGTIHLPKGSKLQGASWSQLQATGKAFQDMNKPKVFIQVGEVGEVGDVEIVDMLFTVKGPTAGVIMVQWNIHASSQGSAGMWDSHIRVGGALGSDLDHDSCPKLEFSEACICASMLLHLTPQASGYFENVWAWVADHDNDMSLYYEIDQLASQISLYGARGILIESQGPSWFYGTGSEHTVLYQYETYNAKNIYLGHIQTESPYYQPKPIAPEPYKSTIRDFPGDPLFGECKDDEYCKEAWGLRVIDSESIIIHSAGLYSWFSNYDQDCLKSESCQMNILDVSGSKDVAIYNLFTKGVQVIASGQGYNLSQKDNQQGFTAEVAVFYPEDEGQIDGIETVFLGPEVYPSHTAQCTSPCLIVLPPYPLNSSTTLDIGEVTTSMEVGHTTTVDGKETFAVTTTTITVTVGKIVTDRLSVSNVNVSEEITPGATFQPQASVPLPVQSHPLTNQDGKVTTRTFTLPPWPIVTGGPTVLPQNDPWNQTTRNPVSDASTFTRPPLYAACPPNTLYVEEKDATITIPHCTAYTTLAWDCPATTTVKIAADTTVGFDLGCIHWTGTGSALPVYTTWPPGELEWVEEDHGDKDDGTSCRLWFFFTCISWGKIKIGGWKWKFPEGILPPGPPPKIKWPPGVTMKKKLPGPWPRVTIAPGPSVIYPEEKPTDCTTESAEICSTTTSFGVTKSDGSTRTTTTKVMSTCATIYGCEVEDDQSTVTTTNVDSCTLPALAARATGAVGAAAAAAGEPPLPCRDNAIIYPKDPENVGGIIDYLKSKKTSKNGKEVTLWSMTKQASAPNANGFTAFFFVPDMPEDMIQELAQQHRDIVLDCYGVYKHNMEHYDSPDGGAREAEDEDDFNSAISKRKEYLAASWELSQVATPPGENWRGQKYQKGGKFIYQADNSFGQGQSIYFIEDGIDQTHPEFSLDLGDDGRRASFRSLRDPSLFGSKFRGAKNTAHGNAVVSKAWGKTLGLARKATAVLVPNNLLNPRDKNNFIHERRLESLVRVLNDLSSNNQDPKAAIINMSFGWTNYEKSGGLVRPEFFTMLRKILKKLDSLGVVMVCAAHNDWINRAIKDRLDGWPVRYGDPNAANDDRINNLIVVGGTNKNTQVATQSPYERWLVMAPGFGVTVAKSGGSNGEDDGNSLATPTVCGLVAYWRALPGLSDGRRTELQDAGIVKNLVYFMQRPLGFADYSGVNGGDFGAKNRVPFIWSGRVGDIECLVDASDDKCPEELRGDLSKLPKAGDASSCGGAGGSLEKRQSGNNACPLPGGGNGVPLGDGITWKPGPASPLCPPGSPDCGAVCSGFYCTANPTGHPQDYYDPEDPDHPDLPPLNQDGQCLGKVKPTKVCNGSGGHSVCVTSSYCSTFPFPPLSSTPSLDPRNCPETSTTMEICNGSGGRYYCSTGTVCSNYPMPTKPSPFPDGCTKAGESCVSVSITPTACPPKVAARTEPPQIFQTPEVSQAPKVSQAPQYVQAHDAPPVRAAVAPASLILPGRRSLPRASVAGVIAADVPFSSVAQANDTLWARDDSGSCFSASCQCEKLDKPECLDITMKSFHEFDHVYILEVTENGKKVCKDQKHECKHCSGTEGTPMDCGGGNNLEFDGNLVKFHSAKQNRDFVYVLPTEDNEDVICFPNFACEARYFHLKIGCDEK